MIPWKEIYVCALCVFSIAVAVSLADVIDDLSVLSLPPIDAYGGKLDKAQLKAKAKEMFMHGYNGYMRYAFPHDELMPISCKGRERGVTPSRGDVDDSLGNFSLTLVDTLDTLIVVGEYDEFERGVREIVEKVRFDADLVVSVFETNIRMIGGLISGHLMGVLLKSKQPNRLPWYTNELLTMASELADRLLPAFNTTSGVPHSRINLRHGMPLHLKRQQDTCTACGGTMILEWAALSRLTGKSVYEEKARRAMDFLWHQRHRGSDLMGTVLNVNSGDWIRRDSGIGAGIDSYYEYTLKTYILLGEEDYLYRFNKHYEAVMRYLSKGPTFIDVHMHKPNVASRPFMDALLAFWPGVQVLKGDLKSAIEFHEMLYNVVKKHKFLPDAFTHDLQIHWAQHPLRPEFIESTYFLYRATKDPHYLEVAKEIMMSLEENVRTTCGFAAVKDVRTMEKEDQMESFVLAETFKYLYMIFAEPSDFIFDPDNYVLTTEAHFLPLTIGESSSFASLDDLLPRRMLIDPDEIIQDKEYDDENSVKKRRFKSACPNILRDFRDTKELHLYGGTIRSAVRRLFDPSTSSPGFAEFSGTCSKASDRLKAWAFSADNTAHLAQLKKMGIEVEIHSDGRLQLSHSTQAAENSFSALNGVEFMQEMVELIREQEREMGLRADRIVQIVSQPHFGRAQYLASPAQFGANLKDTEILAELVKAQPFQGCAPLKNSNQVLGKVAIIRRGTCTFHEKAKFAQDAGAVAVIITDNEAGSSADNYPFFAMSANENLPDGNIHIPAVFLFHLESVKLMGQLLERPTLLVRIAEHVANPVMLFKRYLNRGEFTRRKKLLKNDFLALNEDPLTIRFNFWFGDVSAKSDPNERHIIVERNIEAIADTITFTNENYKHKFLNYARIMAFALLGYPHQMLETNYVELRKILAHLQLKEEMNQITSSINLQLPGTIASSSSIICQLNGEAKNFSCNAI